MNKSKEIINEIIAETKINNIKLGLKNAYKNYKRANSSLWVSALSFYTIFSLVPIFAILFSIGNWLGITDDLLRQIIEYSPLNKESVDILIRFSRNFLENTKTGLLAGLGFLVLGWTLISMFSIIEKSFNDIWHVKKSRTFIRKCTDYFSFIIFFPTLIILSSGATRILEHFGYSSYLINFIPFGTLMVFFTCLYMLIPNTKVDFIPSLVSSIFISLFFYGFQNLFILLQEIVTAYNKIYGSFSVLFIFLFWLRLMWFFLILGAHLCYFMQNKTELISVDVSEVSFFTKEKLGLILIYELSKRYLNSENPATQDEISKQYNIPIELLTNTIQIFINKGYVGEIVGENDKKYYVILKNVESIDFNIIFNILENYGVDVEFNNNINNKIDTIIKDKAFRKKITQI